MCIKFQLLNCKRIPVPYFSRLCEGKRLLCVEICNQMPKGGRTWMAMPIEKSDVERVLRPWLGSLFLNAHPLADLLTEKLSNYAPYRQDFKSLHDELEVLLITRLNSMTNGTLTVILDNYRSRRLGQAAINDLTDDLMGVVFDQLTPFSANFIKLNDYSMRNESLNALRVLYQKYASYYSPDEFAFMVRVIKNVYPEERYISWLKE